MMNSGIVVYFLCLVAFALGGEDFYKLLGVKRDSTKKQISSAFRKMALKYHPDKNTDNPKEAEEKFIEISKAYEVLADKDKRLIYDQYGEDGLKDNGFSQKYSSTNMHDFFSNFDKMFRKQDGGDSQNFFSGSSNFDTFFEDFETMESGEESDGAGILNSLFNAGSTMFGMKKKVKHMKNAVFEEGNIEDMLGDMGGFGGNFAGGFGGMKCKTIKIVRNGMSSSKTVCS